MRRTLVVTLATALLVALPAPVAQAAPCPPAPAADTSTAAGWVGYLAAHRDDVALVIDDGRGGTVRHRPDAAMPTASMVKLVHLAALTGEAGSGRIDLNERIPVAQWQKWFVAAGSTQVDGGAHVNALKYLGIPARDGVPENMSGTVSLHQLADVMIRFSDSAAPDAIRARLGDGPLRAVMQRYGLPGAVPSMKALYDGLLTSGATTSGQLQAAIDRTYSASAASFARLTGDIASGRFGAGSEAARRFLEFQGGAPSGLTALGFKGGSFYGVRTEAFEGRRADGSVTVGVLMVRRAAAEALAKDDAAGMPHQAMLLAAMTDDGARERVACALRT